MVPDKQMESFIKIASQYEENTIYYKPEEIDIRKGTHICIYGEESTVHPKNLSWNAQYPSTRPLCGLLRANGGLTFWERSRKAVRPELWACRTIEG